MRRAELGRPRTWQLRQLIDGVRRRTQAVRCGGMFRLSMGRGHRCTGCSGAGSVRAHQHAADVRERDLHAQPPGGLASELADHALGRSRDGLSTKIHLLCEQGPKPLPVVITGGQRGDSPQFQAVLNGIPGTPPGAGPAPHPPDRGAGRQGLRVQGEPHLRRRRGIACTIPQKADQVRNRKKRGRAGSRPPRLRPGALQAAPRRRARHRPAQTPPRCGHAARQARCALRSHHPHRRDQRALRPSFL